MTAGTKTERITARDAKGVPYTPKCYERGCRGGCAGCDIADGIDERLAEYEDTGLTPEEIMDMSARADMRPCLRCGRITGRNDNYCKWCGWEIDWRAE